MFILEYSSTMWEGHCQLKGEYDVIVWLAHHSSFSCMNGRLDHSSMLWCCYNTQSSGFSTGHFSFSVLKGVQLCQ